jgi:serine/threonine protein kinase
VSLPARLGRLRQVERIGAGGFATVWRYHDEELDSDVAVKALADNWAQRVDIRDRFLEEARILRRADADHVVRVYDNGETDTGTPYFVMSYADRGTVADLLAERRPSVEEALEIIRQAAAGLSVLHRNGIIHRDIKPQNLLLRSRPDGTTEVLVADLGVAKAIAHASGLTQVVGTPAYIAPEQALGQRLDARADVHALGAVAYVLLTGRLVREDGIASLLAPQLPPAPSTVRRAPPTGRTRPEGVGRRPGTALARRGLLRRGARGRPARAGAPPTGVHRGVGRDSAGGDLRRVVRRRRAGALTATGPLSYVSHSSLGALRALGQLNGGLDSTA